MSALRIFGFVCRIGLVLVCSGIVYRIEARSHAPKGKYARVFAQKLVEDALAAHPEISAIEIASTPPNKTKCVTIASTEQKEIGQKCDKDELTAMKTDQPFVEAEKENGQEVYDVTVPIHDAAGKTIATAGMDFKPEPQQQQTAIITRAREIARELESKIQSKEKLFESDPNKP